MVDNNKKDLEKCKYIYVNNRFMAERIKEITGERYYVFTNNDGSIFFSFKNSEFLLRTYKAIVKIFNRYDELKNA